MPLMVTVPELPAVITPSTIIPILLPDARPAPLTVIETLPEVDVIEPPLFNQRP